MLYFAYGSNLCQARLRDRGAEPSDPIKGLLPAHHLRFNKRGLDGSAKANIESDATGDQSACVWGVLYTITPLGLDALRPFEGYPHEYEEREVAVQTESDTRRAITYFACRDFIVEDRLPYDWYLQHVIRGAQHFDLPKDYIQRLQTTPCQRDPDASRRRKQLAYWD